MVTNLIPMPQTPNQFDICALAAEYALGSRAGANPQNFTDEHRASVKHIGLKVNDKQPLQLGLYDSRRYRAEVQNALSSGNGSRGAFLAPVGLIPAVEFSMAAKSAIRRTAAVLRVDGAAVQLAGIDPHATGAAGFIAREGSTNSRQTPSFTKFIFQKQTFAAEYAAPTSMTDDIPGWAEIVGWALGQGIGDIQNSTFTADLVQQATALTLSGTTFNGDNIEDLIAAIGSGHLAGGNCSFMASPSGYLALRKLKDGSGQYLYSRDAGRVAGYPLFINEHLDATGTAGVPILFGDLSRFHIVDDEALSVAPAMEPLVENNATLWYGFLRSAGVLVNAGSNPIAKLVLS